MIRICNFEEYKNDPFGIPTVISRTVKSGYWKEGWIHWTALAPSQDLFNRYQAWRHDYVWSQELFDEVYVPQFIHELVWQVTGEGAMDLNRMYKEREVDRSLICHCTNEFMCHRMIIAGLLMGCGVPVQNYDTSPIPERMVQYWEMYKTERKKRDESPAWKKIRPRQ